MRTIAAFRFALPRTVLRYAGGRELTLGDLGTRQGVLGGINAMIVGNYLTTLGRSAQDDLDLLEELSMPVKSSVGDALTETAAGSRYCDACGEPDAGPGHERCRERRKRTDPPRFCVRCGRKLAVQVLPFGWTAKCVRCGPVSSEIAPGG